MKIVVFTDHFGNGGAERVASLIVNGLLKDSGNEVHVCVFDEVNNYNLNVDKEKFHLLSDPRKGHLANCFFKIFNLTKILKQVRPDVIFSFGPIMAGYVFIAKLLSCHKKLCVIDSERNDPRYEPIEAWKKCVRNYCYNQADLLVCQTPMAVDFLRNLYGIKTKIVIIPNPITPNLPSWNGIHSKEIITACRLTEQKNLPMMIDAFEMLHKDHPAYRLSIYGEGEQKNYLQLYIKKKGLTDVVGLPGFAKDIHQIMANSYMYISSSDYEGISNSMLEALGIGIPCVCTNCPVGGAALYIEDGVSGVLTKVGDPVDLYKGMKRFIENKDFANNASLKSRMVNKELSLEKITNQWIDTIR